MKALTINPGGVIPPDQMVGRGPLIERYWSVLEVRSIALVAPRRVGKSCICNAMHDDKPAGFEMIMRNLEGRKSASEFAQLLYRDAAEFLSLKQRTLKRAADLARRVTGAVDLKGFKFEIAEEDWRQLIEAVFSDLNEYAQSMGKKFVVAWDEFTTFLADLVRNGRAEEAMTLLDLLRAARSAHPHIRMVYNGSIGLAEVLDRLRKLGYANRPTNDIAREVVPLLEPDAAAELSRGLLLSFTADDEALAQHIARICEGHPFAIHHVADRLKHRGEATTVAADVALEALIGDSNDPLDLNHYLDRLGTYFGDTDAEAIASNTADLARVVLDALVGRQLTVTQLHAELGGDRELILATLNKLRRDLYLDRTHGRFGFKLKFLERFWREERGR